MNDTDHTDAPHRPLSRMAPESVTEHPISDAAARIVCQHYVGLGRFPRRFHACREAWWNRLRAAESPEERLTCERMINAVNEALGLHLHEKGAKLSERNMDRWRREDEAEMRAAAEASEAAAIDRWR